jgi:hypothetical protein
MSLANAVQTTVLAKKKVKRVRPELDLILPAPRALEDPTRYLIKIQAYFEAAGLPIPYNLDGDDEFYTTLNLGKRQTLRRHHRIVKMLRKFWLCFDTMENTISCQQYVSVYLKVSKALYGDTAIAAARENVFQDWQRDLDRAQLDLPYARTRMCQPLAKRVLELNACLWMPSISDVCERVQACVCVIVCMCVYVCISGYTCSCSSPPILFCTPDPHLCRQGRAGRRRLGVGHV